MSVKHNMRSGDTSSRLSSAKAAKAAKAAKVPKAAKAAKVPNADKARGGSRSTAPGSRWRMLHDAVSELNDIQDNTEQVIKITKL